MSCEGKGNENVLVTGGSGLVGRAILEEVKKNIQIKNRFNFIFLSSKDADLTDLKQTGCVFDKYRPSYVINLAARVGGLYANMVNNESFCRVNMSINENVLFCSRDLKVKKCLSCLSTCIFPAKIEYPIDETKIHLGPPHSSNQGYSLAKRQVDLINRRYNEDSGKSLFTAIIPTNIYGCHDNFCLEQSHVIPSLIHKSYISAMKAKSSESNETSLRVCGSGKSLRQFIYAPDLAKLILWALEKYTDTEPLILSPDETEEISISYIANTITEIFSKKFGLKMVVEYDVNQSDGQYKKTASNRKFRKLNPEFRFTQFETGIQEVIDWFCLNYPDIRK